MFEPRELQSVLLYGFVKNREAFNRLASEVSVDVFTEPDLQGVYQGMLTLEGRFTVPELAAEVGNPALVRDLVRLDQRLDLPKKPSFESTLRIARKVDKIGQLHQLQVLLTEAKKRLGDSAKADVKGLLKIDASEVVGRLVNDISAIQAGGDRFGYKSYDYYLRQYKHRLNTLFTGGELVDRTPTGFQTLDNATGGLPNGVIVIAGMPGSGKTQLALQLAVNRARRIRQKGEDGVVAINSLEMQGTDLIARAVLSEAKIDSRLLRTGQYNEDPEVRQRLAQSLKNNVGLPIYIDDSDFLNSNMITTRVSGLKSRFKKVVLVITDFLELVRDKGESAEQRASNVILNAKALSKRLDCPVIMISHLSRQVELTGPRIPSIRHLRMSGMIEAIADLVILNYYPYYYLEQGIKIMPNKDMPPAEHVSYEIIGKNRNGPTGYCTMGWDETTTRWYELSSEQKERIKEKKASR